jgi:2-methylisocitrate lyase-like PEP mutase family enzyme
MMGFDDPDLADLAQQAGFTGVHVGSSQCSGDLR